MAARGRTGAITAHFYHTYLTAPTTFLSATVKCVVVVVIFVGENNNRAAGWSSHPPVNALKHTYSHTHIHNAAQRTPLQRRGIPLNKSAASYPLQPPTIISLIYV